jgi:hypothetical protein
VVVQQWFFVGAEIVSLRRHFVAAAGFSWGADMADRLSDVGVFAAYCRAGQWSIVAPVVRELSGRHGIRRIARVPDRSLRRHRSSPPRDRLLLRSLRVRRARHVLPPGLKLVG